MSEVRVVFYKDACIKHRREYFSGDVAKPKTWACETCKETIWVVQ